MKGSINLDRSDIENMVLKVRRYGEQLGVDAASLTLYIPSAVSTFLGINQDESINGVPCVIYKSDEKRESENIFCNVPETVYEGGKWRELTPLEWLASQGLEAL